MIGQAGNGVEALATIERLHPDLRVSRCADAGAHRASRWRAGCSTADRLSQIIFVTAYDQHAIAAFEVNAVDYLLKPVDQARLEIALQRARRRISVRSPPGPGKRQRERQRRSTREDRRARVRAAEPAGATGDQGRRTVSPRAGGRNPLRVVSRTTASRWSRTSMPGTSNYRTLDELQARLDPAVFWRVHRSHLVNINKIKEIVPWFSRNYILRMKDEKATEIPVSRTQTRRLRDYLKL